MAQRPPAFVPSFGVRERLIVGLPAGHPGFASKLSSSEERGLVNFINVNKI